MLNQYLHFKVCSSSRFRFGGVFVLFFSQCAMNLGIGWVRKRSPHLLAIKTEQAQLHQLDTNGPQNAPQAQVKEAPRTDHSGKPNWEQTADASLATEGTNQASGPLAASETRWFQKDKIGFGECYFVYVLLKWRVFVFYFYKSVTQAHLQPRIRNLFWKVELFLAFHPYPQRLKSLNMELLQNAFQGEDF